MSDKKEKFRVKRSWVGGPDVGTEIDGPIHPTLLPHVERIVGGGSDASKAAKILEQAKNESDEIIAGANVLKDEAAKILEQARLDVEQILADAKAEAAKILEEAKPAPAGNNRR